ncbi:MAG: thioredoxin domain-containing protein [Thermodesulfobacteriota bacterium]
MNRLSKEKSPYLLQHAGNPVNWYPWCGEAFETAAREDKPVLVSVGYSTCHWCHVMEKESFEDPEVAELMNDVFISIKVDREERPDIDGVLMSVCQIVSRGNCGWPLNVVMTPGKKPFFAATYIPKHNRYGRAGMVELIPQIKEVWSSRRADIEKSAGDIEIAIRDSQAVMQSEGRMGNEDLLKNGAETLAAAFDPVFGGFGDAPKFPSPQNLIFLLRHWKRTGDAKSLEVAEKTLGSMLDGGINDHIGGGFHRYSTDRRWLVPHFEKMLHDQALICAALTEAWLATSNPAYKNGAEKTLEYVMRDMTASGGAFFSAEDADSEGEEGKFYLWSEEEFRETAGEDEARIAAEVFTIKSGGNFVDEATGKMPGTNIPHRTKPLSFAAETAGTDKTEAERLTESAVKNLFERREKRPRPHKDDKILTDWNGLMIAAFSKAGRAFGRREYVEAAKTAADFILANMFDGDELLHRFRDGDAAIRGNLDDYAFMVWGLLELYEAGFDISRLKTAMRLNDKMMELFSDEEKGGFFFTPSGAENLIVRKKEFHDGALPCGNSVAALNLMKISRLTGNHRYDEDAAKIARSLSLSVEKLPSSHGMLLCALEFAAGKTFEVVIAEGTDGAEKVTDALAKNYEPGATVLLKKPDCAETGDIAPFAAGCSAGGNGKTLVYVCEDGTCGLPSGADDFAASVAD